jgi:hypothetical protein
MDKAGSVKLLETTDKYASYICLSHCWGKENQPLKCTTANLNEWKSRIDWDLLPQTFQDAIDFVRRLGQRYLWIDSLCILQDDRDDWDEQSVKMAEIYENSYLTLAASWASDCTGGLYHKDSPEGKSYTAYYRKVTRSHLYRADIGAGIERILNPPVFPYSPVPGFFRNGCSHPGCFTLVKQSSYGNVASV